MNKKYEKNLSKQKIIREKIESLQNDLQELKNEQEEMENIEILKGYKSIGISLDDFLEMMKKHKKERKNEEKPCNYQNEEPNSYANVSKDMEEKINEES